MPEIGPGGRWIINREIAADPGGCMAVISDERYRPPCIHQNPGMPVYSKDELVVIKHVPHSARFFRLCQRVKRVFPKAMARWEEHEK